ncbi:UAA transporter family-domain-containing protein [Pisolithus croceorrhizus]|nr:UAA transporter family-domain-containing protein [Pisolithus croceorrhizus]
MLAFHYSGRSFRFCLVVSHHLPYHGFGQILQTGSCHDHEHNLVSSPLCSSQIPRRRNGNLRNYLVHVFWEGEAFEGIQRVAIPVTDEIFLRYKVTGQQMMFWMNIFSVLLNLILGTLPLPYIPVLHPSSDARSELASALAFVREHPSIVVPLLQFSLTSALGQLFIFETLQHFGSLTLVTITLTRKMFTMILSVVVYSHWLTAGQWVGATIVFAGISVEAWVKRKDVHAKRVVEEKEKAKIKTL